MRLTMASCELRKFKRTLPVGRMYSQYVPHEGSQPLNHSGDSLKKSTVADIQWTSAKNTLRGIGPDTTNVS